jgi:radical SAM superfamily enzyme YgiQ (UPF0313 family)
MRVGLIAPSWELYRKHRGDTVFFLAPLTFPVLAALTPSDIEVDVIEERVRDIPFSDQYDLVGITFVTAFAPRAYNIADRFRERGVTVVLGGPHATALPREALEHADAVVVGEAEQVWASLLDDFRQGRLRRIYQAPGLTDLALFPSPRLEVIPKEFTFRKATLASKGCPFHCDFCFVNKMNHYHQRFRPISHVYRDIASMEGDGRDGKYFIFWDDNLAGEERYTKELCRAIAPLKKRWAGAASVNIARDDELLLLLEQSGCQALFIGFESINQASLDGTGKRQNHVRHYREILKRLHDRGIAVTGAFVFGFDHDDPEVFDRTLEFAIDINLDCITPALLTPLPQTSLFDEMHSQGRIIDTNWAHYDYQHVVYRPKQFTPDELYERYLRFLNDFFSYRSILKRLGHSRCFLLISGLANLGYHRFYKRMLADYEQDQ